ncbi:MAG: hypothetical protein ABIZ80_18795 [Bryobacteraceae bacterium]
MASKVWSFLASAEAMVFHEPDCPAIITSTPEGWLACAECGRPVGMVEAPMLKQIIELGRTVIQEKRAATEVEH